MTMPEINRRAFLSGVAAVAASATLSATAADAVAGATREAVTSASAPKPMFGYSFNGGEWWETGFYTHEEALAAAKEAAEDEMAREGSLPGVAVGRVVPVRVCIPRQLNEAVAEAVADGQKISYAIFDCLEGVNEEADWEGELLDAFHSARQIDGDAMVGECREVVAIALLRAGQPAIAGHVRSTDCPYKPEISDELYERLADDPELQADLHRIVTAWVDRHDLWEAGRLLNSFDVVEYSPDKLAQVQA